MTELSHDEAEAFVRAVVQLASMADRVLPPRGSPLAARLSAHLGGVGDDVSSTSMSVPVIVSSALTAALDAMLEHATPVMRSTLAGPPAPS